MKKFLLFSAVSLIFINGCASKKLDTCTFNKLKCNSECLLNYPQKDIKYKLCITKCKSIYYGCRAKEKAKEGLVYIKEKVSD